MSKFSVLKREEVSESNQVLFDNLQKMVGFVPNMYTVFAYSPTALGDYLTLQNRKGSLTDKEREIVNLLVSQLNGCNYCKAAHTAIGKMIGFTEEQTVEIRRANISFDSKFDALAKVVKEIVENKEEVTEHTLSIFYNQGYDNENLVDVVINVGDKIMTNYLFALSKVPVDWPTPQAI